MRNCNAPKNLTARRILIIACAAALTTAFTVSLPQSAHAEQVTPPPVPFNLEVPPGNHAFLVGHAVGTQNYICLPSGSGFAYSLFTPEATLFNDDGDQLITHFFSVNPNPKDNGAIRATWESSRDTSTIWAGVFLNPQTGLIGTSTDPKFVAKGAVPWLLLNVVGDATGPTGGHRLTSSTFVQRLNTSGGVAPSTGCASPTDVGRRAFVPYTADYFFYRSDDGNE
jgi:hypothetical protein